jgi:methylenetetrahydrofolate reductase (NADPH)
MMNKFGKALMSGRLLVTAECFPPAGSDAVAVKKLSSWLPRRLDAVVVSDNPDRIRSSAFSTAVLLSRQRKASVVLSMSTRDRNRIALLSDALGAAAMDIEAILCVSGHHQSLEVCSQAASANDLDSVQFVQAMKKIVLTGSGMNGKEIEPKLDMQIGATANPCMRPLELNLLRLKKKIVVGADFLLTQAVFDLNSFAQWMDGVRATQLDKRTAIIAGVMPLTDVAKAKELQKSRIYGPIGDDIIERISQAPDAAREGVAIASEIAGSLKIMPGIRGIHILSRGCEALTAEIMKRAGL